MVFYNPDHTSLFWVEYGSSTLLAFMLVGQDVPSPLDFFLTDPQVLAVLLAWLLWSAVYNVFLHPLHSFPGPKSAAATPLPYAWRLCNGRMVDWTTALHEKYGTVVRIHPNELSFVGHAAWQDVFGCRPELPPPHLTIKWPNGVPPLPTIVNTEDHTRQRRIVGHAFSDRALREQECLLQKHSDALISRLTDQARHQKSYLDIDICSWYYFTTFDVIGDLCFSEGFRSLECAVNHSRLAAVFDGIKVGKILTAFDHIPPLGTVVRWCISHLVQDGKRRHFDWTRQKIDHRIAQNTDSPDFLTYVLENNDKKGMTRDEIDSTMTNLLITGSGDTLVAAMGSLTYYALKNPSVMSQLQEEVRSAMGDSSENITIAAVSKLEYLDAALKEAMRMHAPVPASNPRVVNRPGVRVDGLPIPQGTRVGIPQKTAYQLPRNFVDPKSFLPERWLPDPDGRFAADDKAVFEPFLVGPRKCLGKSLALAEMKLILAKVFWHFDLALSEKTQEDWCDQRSYLIYEKKPLYIKLKLRALTAAM
ncbi:hypothetical protein MMC17_001219 [Xylographa soralifera]|nr:hypothetical protein [Xylographa soralifera]